MRIIHVNEETAIAEAGKLGVIKILLPIKDVGAEIRNPGIEGAPNLAGSLEPIVAARLVVNGLRQAVAIRAANLAGLRPQRREGQVRRFVADENDGFTGLKMGGAVQRMTRATDEKNRGPARQRKGQGFVKRHSFSVFRRRRRPFDLSPRSLPSRPRDIKPGKWPGPARRLTRTLCLQSSGVIGWKARPP